MTDPEAIQRFQDLYDQYHRRVRAYAVSRAGRGLADEVVSEVFLVAWRRRGEMPATVLPWLLAVARNVVTSQFRATVRQESIAAEMQVWVKEQQAASDVADEVAERISVLTALAALPEPDRELLTLVAWHGLSPREAAQVVGCSTATYFVRLHRARRRLERALAADRGPAPQGVPAPRARTSPGNRPSAGKTPAKRHSLRSLTERSVPHEQAGESPAWPPVDGHPGARPPVEPGHRSGGAA